MIVCNPVETVLEYRSASMALQNNFHGGGFEFWYLGMRFCQFYVLALLYVVLVVFTIPSYLSVHLAQKL